MALTTHIRRPLALLLVPTLIACGARYRPGAGAPPYLVTAAPIDVGLAGRGLCIAVDPSSTRGVWWWQPGSAGCAHRSTGPGLFEAQEASVSRPAGAAAIDVGFRLQLHSLDRPFLDVRLVIDGDEMRAPASGARVPIVRRRALDIPAEGRELDRRP